jgi:formylglycine-generating enzyme required for sulfatase activity
MAQYSGDEVTEAFISVGRSSQSRIERLAAEPEACDAPFSSAVPTLPLQATGAFTALALALALGLSACSPAAFVPVDEASLRDGDTFRDCETCPLMVVIPAGKFMMGSPANEKGRKPDEEPQREVAIQRFAAAAYELTFAEWDACAAGGGCKTTPKPDDEGWGREQRPIMNVSWNDAQEYVVWLSAKTGQTYRLLSEAEWEYAARAGTTTPVWTGAGIKGAQANLYDGTDGTQPVGSYPKNPFGLFDVNGNVWEWVEDCYANSYGVQPTDGRAYLGGDCEFRVLRGGSWNSFPRNIRSAIRYLKYPTYQYSDVGLRLARTLSPPAP